MTEIGKDSAHCRPFAFLHQARAIRETPVQHQQAHADDSEERTDREIGNTPAEVIGRKSANPDASRQSDDLADQKARQNWLALLVRHHVSDPRHRQRDQCCRSGACQSPSNEQHVEVWCQPAQRGSDGAGQACPRNDPVLAQAVPKGAEQ